MKFAVCIKQVPDVSAPIQVSGGQLVMDAGRVVLDWYAASAVEAALVLAETHGGTVDVVLVGPERATEAVRKALAMGADAGTHWVVPEGAELDSAAVAALLADHLRDGGYDAILTGKQAQDTDAGLAGGMLAEALGLPVVTNAVGLAQEGDALVVTRQGDSGQEVVVLSTPCVVTCSNDMNDPRIPNLKGIMAAKKKTIDTRPAAEVRQPRVRTLAFEPVPQRAPGRRFDGDAAEVVPEVVRLMGWG